MTCDDASTACSIIRLQIFSRDALHVLGAHVAVPLKDRNHRRLVLNRTRSLARPRFRTTAGAPLVTVFASPVLAAAVGFVNLNDPGQLRYRWFLAQRPPNAVRHKPCCTVSTLLLARFFIDALELTLPLMCTDAFVRRALQV